MGLNILWCFKSFLDVSDIMMCTPTSEPVELHTFTRDQDYSASMVFSILAVQLLQMSVFTVVGFELAFFAWQSFHQRENPLENSWVSKHLGGPRGSFRLRNRSQDLIAHWSQLFLGHSKLDTSMRLYKTLYSKVRNKRTPFVYGVYLCLWCLLLFMVFTFVNGVNLPLYTVSTFVCGGHRKRR